ncbi:MAG: adenosine deaminase family protein, partial [Vibrio sp.]
QVEVRLIPSINREKSPECAVEMVEQVVAYPHPYVLGIGIDYKEQNASVEMFWKAYRLAQKHDLKTTAHCSEFGLHWRNVEAGVELIGVDRIDHGYSIIDNPELTYQYAKSGLPFTVVPSNTYFLQKWPERANWCEYHPIRDMAQAGLMIIPCTDDWHMHATDGVICYRTMVEELGFDVQSLKYFILNSLEASWMPSYKKSAYLAAWQEEFDQLFDQLTETPPSFHNDLIAYRGSLHTQMMLNQDNGAL